MKLIVVIGMDLVDRTIIVLFSCLLVVILNISIRVHATTSSMGPATTENETTMEPATMENETTMEPAIMVNETTIMEIATTENETMEPATTENEIMEPATTENETIMEPATMENETIMEPATTENTSPATMENATSSMETTTTATGTTASTTEIPSVTKEKSASGSVDEFETTADTMPADITMVLWIILGCLIALIIITLGAIILVSVAHCRRRKSKLLILILCLEK